MSFLLMPNFRVFKLSNMVGYLEFESSVAALSKSKLSQMVSSCSNVNRTKNKIATESNY